MKRIKKFLDFPKSRDARLVGPVGPRLPETKVQDGPFADAKEQLDGLMVIEVENLDAAVEWAARSPAASSGGVEIRPEQVCDVS